MINDCEEHRDTFKKLRQANLVLKSINAHGNSYLCTACARSCKCRLRSTYKSPYKSKTGLNHDLLGLKLKCLQGLDLGEEFMHLIYHYTALIFTLSPSRMCFQIIQRPHNR